jgi:hypothetical protein
MQQDDDTPRHRSRWSSREGERWWWGAVTYVGGAITTLLFAAAIVAIVIEELWIVLAAIAVIAGLTFAIWSFLNGDSWWNF